MQSSWMHTNLQYNRKFRTASGDSFKNNQSRKKLGHFIFILEKCIRFQRDGIHHTLSSAWDPLRLSHLASDKRRDA